MKQNRRYGSMQKGSRKYTMPFLPWPSNMHDRESNAHSVACIHFWILVSLEWQRLETPAPVTLSNNRGAHKDASTSLGSACRLYSRPGSSHCMKILTLSVPKAKATSSP